MLRQTRIGDWYFYVSRGQTRWIGLAKKEPFVNGDPIKEPGDVWFEIDDTEEAALMKIKRSVLQ